MDKISLMKRPRDASLFYASCVYHQAADTNCSVPVAYCCTRTFSIVWTSCQPHSAPPVHGSSWESDDQSILLLCSSSSSSDFMGWVSSRLLLPNSLLSMNLSSLFLKTSSDGASTTSCGNRFQQLTTIWVKSTFCIVSVICFCTVCSYVL